MSLLHPFLGQMQALDLVPISFSSRSDSLFSYIFHSVHSVICCWWHERWIEFSVLHSVRTVILRFGDVSDWCAEWTVHSVICCWWHKSWIEFSCVLHRARIVLLRFGDVSGWCAEWTVHSVICCWWHKSWIEFSCVLHRARIVLLRFGEVIGCDE